MATRWAGPRDRDFLVILAPSSLLAPLAAAVPTMMPRIQVDTGAIKYVFGGANVMCPGITSAGEQRLDAGWRSLDPSSTLSSNSPHCRSSASSHEHALPSSRSAAPGAGGAIPVELPEGAPVAVFAQGKEHAMAIGVLKMSTADMCVRHGCRRRRRWRRRGPISCSGSGSLAPSAPHVLSACRRRPTVATASPRTRG
jgi:hypothetical protein